MVVDGGPDPGRLLIALDERLPPWDRRIDVLVLTHPHEDHVAGLALLLQRYRVGRVYEPGMLGPGPGYDAWASVLAAGGPPRGRLSTGDQLTLDCDPLSRPLAGRQPRPGAARRHRHGINNVSIVLLGEVAGRRFLLAGDVEEESTRSSSRGGCRRSTCSRSRTTDRERATTREFLEAVRPSVAVVSAGAGNPYGHPAPATLERLAELAGRTYRTDTDGAVEVAFGGDGLRVRTTGPRRPAATAAERDRAGESGQPAAVAPRCVPVRHPRPRHLAGFAAAPRQSPGRRSRPRRRATPLPRGRSTGPATQPARSGARAAAGSEDRGANRHSLPSARCRPPRPRRPRRARDRSPRLLLGRRRVRPRGGAGRVPQRPAPVSRWPAGALATGGRAHRTRPPPR